MPLLWCKNNCCFSPVDDSTPNSTDSECDDNSKYVAIHGDSSLLKFTNEDVAFCVGIDKLNHRDFVGREERFRGHNQIAKDAKSMGKAFTTKLNLQDDKVKVSIASNEADKDDCKKQGLRTLFLKFASLAKSNANFIFYFAGHGFGVNEKYVLAPSDYADGTETTGILGDDLVQWLNEAECKAKNVLFIFDCCYAGNLSKSLTKDTELKIPARLFTMCGCASGEIISSIGALGHSIFTYFLLDHLETSELNITEAIQDIRKLCVSLSSLVIMYDNERGKVYPGKFTPELFELGIVQRIILPTPDEKAIVVSLRGLLPENGVNEEPNAHAISWLRSSEVREALVKLSDRAYHRTELQTGIVSALLHSLAVMHYAHANEDGRKLLKSRNLFLVVAVDVSKEIDFCELTMDQIMTGLKHYIYVVEKYRIDSSDLHKLHSNMDALSKNL